MKKYKFIHEFDKDTFTHAIETAMADLESKGAGNFQVLCTSHPTVYSAVISYEIEEHEQERKEASWLPLFDGKFTGGAYWFKCSECGRIVPDVRNGGWRFCPNCGVDMMP